jgi:drug/metabolite transporter (DMT)-like permease
MDHGLWSMDAVLKHTMNRQQSRLYVFTGFLITLIGAVLFSTKAIIVKKAFNEIDVDVLSLLALRMVFSLPFYLVAAFWISSQKENKRLNKRQWLTVLMLGLSGYYLSSYLDFAGLQYISAGLERLILFLYPTFAVLINLVVFKQKISKIQKLALFLTYVGIGIAYIGEMNFSEYSSNLLLGSLLVFLCAITYASYIVGSGRIIPQIGATKFTAYAMLAATLGVFVHYLLSGSHRTGTIGDDIWLYGFTLAIIATVIPSFLLSFGLKRIGSNNVAIISGIGPVATIVQAHYILGEPIFPAQITGTILVILGVLLIGWRKNKIVST